MTPSDSCLDPETLALWVDDGLSAADRATAERHVADCARCQATLAALVRTAPVSERGRPWWTTSRAAWLAPLAAAAAALVIWIAVPGAPPRRSPEPSTPAQSTPASAPAASPPPLAKQAAAEKAPTVTAKVPAVERRDERVAEVSPPPAAAPAAPAPPPVTFRALSGAAADFAARSASQANAVSAEIVSPELMSRWRITGGRLIEHSTDGGATWQPQAAGVPSTLTAGSAPSPLVCWLVGQDGVVLLSTDGRTWRRVSFPAATALVSVRATDERTATVIDVNGRTYVTSDGGVQWTQP